MSCSEALLRKAQEGDKDALEAFVKENTGLVKSIAIRFSGRNVDFEDLCQLGHIGMLKAIKNFDMSRGTAFSTYAVPLIIGEIRRFLRDDGSIKIGRELKKKNALVLRVREEYVALRGCEPTVSELSALCGIDCNSVVESINACGSTVSFSEPIGDMTLEDTLGADCIPELSEKIALRQAIDRLSDEDRTLILLRYYGNLSQRDTGRRLGMTQVTVSRKEKQILKQLSELLL